MNVWEDGAAPPADRGPFVASIGNYDGVHLGHRTILDAVVADAERRGLPALLITFEPHPLAIVAPQRRPRLLQTRRQKLRALSDAGLSDVLIVPFDARLAALSGEAFFSEVLAAAVRFAAIHVGANFRFGHRREGDQELLRAIGGRLGFDTHCVDPVAVDGRPVSSSAIRAAVESGDVVSAARMLGRPFAVEGQVVRGDGRGRALRFPTANLELHSEIAPARGVYVTEALLGEQRQPSVTNVGVRPTFGYGERLVVESHLLRFEGDLYGRELELAFQARLRDERRFSGPAELAEQIARDRAAAEAFFRGRLLG